MRLSEERINDLARRMIAELERTRCIRVVPARRKFAATRIAKVVLDDLTIEDEIDREARERLHRMPSAPPENTPEWQLLFRREKEALAARRNYVL